MKYFDEEDAITEYEKQLQKKDNEIERLKEEYVMLQNASDEVEEEKDKEIERLNNIINELEKWLESESNFWKEQQEKAIENGWLEFGGKYNTTIIYENAINKLQELKGSVKE